MADVAIIGIGIHPFGRTEGVSGLQQGVHAAKEALSDAELEWKDIEFAYGGSAAAGSADTMVSELGLTGIPFMNVSNGCATGGSALLSAYTTIKSGQFDIGMAVTMTPSLLLVANGFNLLQKYDYDVQSTPSGNLHRVDMVIH